MSSSLHPEARSLARTGAQLHPERRSDPKPAATAALTRATIQLPLSRAATSEPRTDGCRRRRPSGADGSVELPSPGPAFVAGPRIGATAAPFLFSADCGGAGALRFAPPPRNARTRCAHGETRVSCLAGGQPRLRVRAGMRGVAGVAACVRKERAARNRARWIRDPVRGKRLSPRASGGLRRFVVQACLVSRSSERCFTWPGAAYRWGWGMLGLRTSLSGSFRGAIVGRDLCRVVDARPSRS